MNNSTIIKGSNRRPQVKPRIIKPTNRLIIKYYLYVFISFIAITTAITIFIGFINFMAMLDGEADLFKAEFFQYAILLYLGVWILFIVMMLILIPWYVNSMVFSVHGNEIRVKKGILNITEKYVPYSAITNLDVRAGLLDRALGIGTVEIQTAGFSGGSSSSSQPEEKFEGLTVYKEIREYIVKQLYSARTGEKTAHVRKLDTIKSNLQQEIISELKTIKIVLKKGDLNGKI